MHSDQLTCGRFCTRYKTRLLIDHSYTPVVQVYFFEKNHLPPVHPSQLALFVEHFDISVRMAESYTHSRGKSPVRGHTGDVFLLNTEENTARSALEAHLQQTLNKYNENFTSADVRLLPASLNDRDRDYYIFPFLFRELHSLGFLEEFIRSQLAEALDGRAVQIRIARDQATGESRHYIDIATRKPKSRQSESKGGSSVAYGFFILLVLLGISGLISAHQMSLN